MELSSLKFILKSINEISIKDKEFLIDAYHKLFVKIYGGDVIDAFNHITKTSVKELINNNGEMKYLATNYKSSIELLQSLENNPNNELMLIYMNNNLIGSAYIKRINDSICSLPFVALNVTEKDLERDIWKHTVLYVSKCFEKAGYEKMYLEIPLKEGPLLIRANELGFVEDPSDIEISQNVYTYILNKNLKGNNNDK